MTKDIVKLVERYHDALNKYDFDAIEKMFAEDAEYYSSGIGGVYGRDAIMHAMKAYFFEFSDQVSTDDSLELVDETSVRAHWRLTATTKSSGRKVTRQGLETVHFNAKGLISVVEVQDVEAVRD
jgi:ketosteroid isomerase-like protein